MFISSERLAGAVLLLGVRVAEGDVAEAARVLRLIQSPPVSADAICIEAEGPAVVLGVALLFDGDDATWPSVDLRSAGDALIAVFRAADVGVVLLDSVPSSVSSHLLAVLGGSDGS